MARDYAKYAADYQSGVSSAELARRAGMNPGQMYRGLRSLGLSMRSASKPSTGKPRPSGDSSATFKGGAFIDKDGYVRVRGLGRFRLEHRLIAEKAIGRQLRAGEVVHHINGIKTDNRIQNLLVCTAAYHRLIHARMDAMAACGNPNWLRCRYCGQHDSPGNLSVSANTTAYHKTCAATYQRNRRKT